MKRLQKYWERSKDLHESRTEFDQFDFVRDVRGREYPLPWRFNDIIGWIDITAFLRGKRIQVGLFLPKSRISRQLKQKKYVMQAHKHVPYSDRSTNQELRKHCSGFVASDSSFTV
jgi:hypothetical protein